MEHETILGVFLHCAVVLEEEQPPCLSCPVTGHWDLQAMAFVNGMLQILSQWTVFLGMMEIEWRTAWGWQLCRAGCAFPWWNGHISCWSAEQPAGSVWVTPCVSKPQSYLCLNEKSCLNGARSGISVKGYSFLDLLSLAWLDLIFTGLQTDFC